MYAHANTHDAAEGRMKPKGRILKAYPCASAKQILHAVSYPSSLVLNNLLYESALQSPCKHSCSAHGCQQRHCTGSGVLQAAKQRAPGEQDGWDSAPVTYPAETAATTWYLPPLNKAPALTFFQTLFDALLLGCCFPQSTFIWHHLFWSSPGTQVLWSSVEPNYFYLCERKSDPT